MLITTLLIIIMMRRKLQLGKRKGRRRRKDNMLRYVLSTWGIKRNGRAEWVLKWWRGLGRCGL